MMSTYKRMIAGVPEMLTEVVATLSLEHVRAVRVPEADETAGGVTSLGYRLVDTERMFPAHVFQLAEIRECGMQVDYLLVVPGTGGEDAAGNRCHFSVTLEAAEPLTKLMGDEGAVMGNVRVPVDLEVGKAVTGVGAKAFDGRAYDAISPLVGMGNSSIGGPPIGSGLASREECGEWAEEQVRR